MYYHTLNDELRRRFGCKVYKLALDGGFTCPNRDGVIGTRGCIFCAGDGSGAFAADRALSVPQQIEAAKARVRAKNGGGKYIAYFQNFTNTNKDIVHDNTHRPCKICTEIHNRFRSEEHTSELQSH